MTAESVVPDVPWGPADDGLDQPYWEGLRESRLRLQRCPDCRTWIWGPQSVCPSCFSLDLGWEDVEPVGTVYSWTRSWHPYIEELADQLPYVSVLVELPGAGGRRVLGILADDPGHTPAIGDSVTGVFEAGEPWPLLRWTAADAATVGATESTSTIESTSGVRT